MKKWLKETWKELSSLVKGIGSLKDGIYIIALIGSACVHAWGCHKLNETNVDLGVAVYQRDSVTHKVKTIRIERDSAFRIADSCKESSK